MSRVLVLDCSYQPVQQVDIKKVMRWIVKRKIEVIDEHPDKYINSEMWTLNLPSIVRLLRPVTRKKAIKFSRHNVYLRDKGKCQYCGIHVSQSRFTFDHVVPRSQGGTTTFLNVCCACISCNQRKAGRTPEQANMKLLSVPIRPKSLPDVRRDMAFTDDMPASWRDFLYWNAELENDEK